MQRHDRTTTLTAAQPAEGPPSINSDSPEGLTTALAEEARAMEAARWPPERAEIPEGSRCAAGRAPARETGAGRAVSGLCAELVPSPHVARPIGPAPGERVGLGKRTACAVGGGGWVGVVMVCCAEILALPQRWHTGTGRPAPKKALRRRLRTQSAQSHGQGRSGTRAARCETCDQEQVRVRRALRRRPCC